MEDHERKEMLQQLDVRHEKLLEDLNQLDQRIEQALTKTVTGESATAE